MKIPTKSTDTLHKNKRTAKQQIAFRVKKNTFCTHSISNKKSLKWAIDSHQVSKVRLWSIKPN